MGKPTNNNDLVEKLFEKCYNKEFCCLAEIIVFLYDNDKKCKKLLDVFWNKVNKFADDNKQKSFGENDLINHFRLNSAVKRAASEGIKNKLEKDKAQEKIIEELNDATDCYRQSNLTPNIEWYFRYLLSTDDIADQFYDVISQKWGEENICYNFAERLYDELSYVDVNPVEKGGKLVYSSEAAEKKKQLAQKVKKPIFENDIANKLKTRIVGQDYAVEVLSKALLAPANGFSNKNAPTLGGFMLAGAPGIGKTEIAKAIADTMFDGRLCIVRGGDFSSDVSITTLTGAGAGLVGYGEPNPIQQKVDEWQGEPGVVLIDEFDQAHPNIMRWLYSILDEGRFNAQSKTKSMFGNEYETVEVSLKNVLIILTTNLGMDKSKLGFKQNGTEEQETAEKIDAILKSGSYSSIPKALFDRVKIIPMVKLTAEEQAEATKRICKTTTTNLQKTIKDKLNKLAGLQNSVGVKVSIATDAIEQLLKLGGGSLRSVKRYLNDDIYNLVLSSELKAEAELQSAGDSVDSVNFRIAVNQNGNQANPFVVSTKIKTK